MSTPSPALTPAGAPAPSFGTFVAEVHADANPFTTEKGETFYLARAEVPTPGFRWSTMRLKIASTSPIRNGRAHLMLKEMKASDGLGKAEVLSYV